MDRAERAELAEHLLASLEDESERLEGWDEAWAAEVEQRSLDGPEHWVDGREALQQLFGSEP